MKINENFLKLPSSYLFSTIAQKIAAYQQAHPQADIIRLGIGDVTAPCLRLSLMRCTRLLTKWRRRKASTVTRRSMGRIFLLDKNF